MRRLIVGAGAALALLTGPASALADSANETAEAWRERPMSLPSSLRAASSESPTDWLIGGRPSHTATVIARRNRARPLRVPGVFSVPRGRARTLAGQLRRNGVLLHAEPDVRLDRNSAFEAQPDGWARVTVASSSLAAPPPGTGATIAIVDDVVDPNHPDVGPQTRYLNTKPLGGSHGTEVASVAAGARNGTGVYGVFPGARLLSYGLGDQITCADAADGIVSAAAVGARVINLSFGSANGCFALFEAVQLAYAAGSLVVASSGNEFVEGNPVTFPAAYPHVLSVAALDTSLKPAFFSTANLAVDIAAPGAQVPVATPVALDTDGVADGTTLADGTSFAAPMVAGAAAWLATVRPALTNGQVADVLRRSATDIAPGGYDSDTGYGSVNMPRALAFPTPKADALEPNDGVPFVDGTVFPRKDPYVWRGSGRKRFSASVDQVEDPIDVYRIRVPPKAAFRILLHPTFGDPDLRVLSSRARTTDDRRALIDESRRGEGRTDVASLINNAGSPRAGYVVVDAAEDRSGGINAAYRLELLRERRR